MTPVAPLRGLYAITPESLPRAALLARAGAALEGGARVLQYRAKHAPRAQCEETARALTALCRSHGALFIVNDDAELAAAVGADGVHVGRDDAPVAAARRALPRGVVGVSCYDSLARARSAVAEGADYVAFGSMFASPTKPAAVRAPLALMREARALGVPLAAIGGITLERAPALLEAGADMLAVITDLFDAADVRARAQDYAGMFQSFSSNPAGSP